MAGDMLTLNVESAMLSVKQAAHRLGISRQKLYLMVSRREIPHFKIGSKILFTEADLQAYLAGCRVEPRKPVPVPSVPPAKALRHLSLE
jgi:excisionase family DNA binding protein